MTKLDCPVCGSSQTYYRRKTKDYACKSCPATYQNGKLVKSKASPLHPNKGLKTNPSALQTPSSEPSDD